MSKIFPKFAKLPRHMAIILDGNGRWAQKRGLSRSEGHRAGGENLKKLLDVFIELNIPFVSLYAFSAENWKRPHLEIESLWSLLNEFFTSYLQRCQELGIKIRISGDISGVPQKSRDRLSHAAHETADNKRLTVNFCINYGSQQEILRACTMIIQERFAKYKSGKEQLAKAQVKPKEFEKYLYTKGMPAVDLLIRPGGEMRISNFLLWQCAYAQIYASQTLWPDFNQQDLLEALNWFACGHRRFGGL